MSESEIVASHSDMRTFLPSGEQISLSEPELLLVLVFLLNKRWITFGHTYSKLCEETEQIQNTTSLDHGRPQHPLICNTFCSKASGKCYLVNVFKLFDKRSRFQLWNDICYLGNPYVRNKSYIGCWMFKFVFALTKGLVHRC